MSTLDDLKGWSFKWEMRIRHPISHYRWYQARRFSNRMLDLDISEIRIRVQPSRDGRYFSELVFFWIDDKDRIEWVPQELVSGSKVKKFLNRKFGRF